MVTRVNRVARALVEVLTLSRLSGQHTHTSTTRIQTRTQTHILAPTPVPHSGPLDLKVGHSVLDHTGYLIPICSLRAAIEKDNREIVR